VKSGRRGGRRGRRREVRREERRMEEGGEEGGGRRGGRRGGWRREEEEVCFPLSLALLLCFLLCAFSPSPRSSFKLSELLRERTCYWNEKNKIWITKWKGVPKGRRERRARKSKGVLRKTGKKALSLPLPPPSAQPRLLEHGLEHQLRRVGVAIAAPRKAGLLARGERGRGLRDALGEALVADGLL
jgi:hypothetical protein